MRLQTRKRPTLAQMVAEAANELAPRREVKDSVQLWIPMPSQPGRGLVMPDGKRLSPQEAALESFADELFFGGAPGGGKTHLILGAAVTRHRNSIIFRREFSQLRGAEGIWQQSHDIIGVRGRPTESPVMMWRDLPGDRTIEFGATGHLPQHYLKYKGRPHDLKAFDELPEIGEDAYRFLIGWLRTKYEGQRTRSIGTGNPPVTSDAKWVIGYWAPWLDPHHLNPAKPGELRWFVVGLTGKDVEVPGPTYGPTRPKAVLIGGSLTCKHVLDVANRCEVCSGKFVEPRSRTFIPSQLEDNPYYMRTGYAAVLDNMPEPLRSLMRTGNFSAAIPDDQWQVIPTAWVDAAQQRWIARGLTRATAPPMTRAGNDPSRGGEDEFVVATCHGDWVDELHIFGAKEAPDGEVGASLVMKSVMDANVRTQIDIGGSAGSSVYDHCKGKLGMNAIALNGSEASAEKDRSGKLGFMNKRAKWYWRMRELLDPAYGSTFCLPPDRRLKEDLCATRWEPTHRGVIACEDKEKVKARLRRSPDRGEAVIYASVEESESGQAKPIVAGVWGSARGRT